jgi:hypothetical protein
MFSVPALVSFEVLSKVGEGGETGVTAAGAMMDQDLPKVAQDKRLTVWN